MGLFMHYLGWALIIAGWAFIVGYPIWVYVAICREMRREAARERVGETRRVRERIETHNYFKQLLERADAREAAELKAA